MKIIGFTYIDGRAELVLRADSCLLNGKKPFFIPDGSQDVRANRAVILRVSRLGKNIQQKFANRYYDAWAPGLDIIAWDKLEQARANGRSWTEAIAFDYSLPLGDWLSEEELGIWSEQLCISPAKAIEQASRLMTIRQGDLIYIDYAQHGVQIQREDIIEGPAGLEDKLYCKIK
mgnify:CR=1 FL=1